jgi:hypothetical protein
VLLARYLRVNTADPSSSARRRCSTVALVLDDTSPLSSSGSRSTRMILQYRQTVPSNLALTTMSGRRVTRLASALFDLICTNLQTNNQKTTQKKRY